MTNGKQSSSYLLTQDLARSSRSGTYWESSIGSLSVHSVPWQWKKWKMCKEVRKYIDHIYISSHVTVTYVGCNKQKKMVERKNLEKMRFCPFICFGGFLLQSLLPTWSHILNNTISLTIDVLLFSILYFLYRTKQFYHRIVLDDWGNTYIDHDPADMPCHNGKWGLTIHDCGQYLFIMNR